MAYISNLPNEMLARIGAFISKRLDLANLRLVNRRLSAVATEAYFANIALYPDWVDAVEDEGEKEEWQLEVEERRKAANWPNAIVYDVASFQRILDNKDFKRLVKRVTVYMCNPDCDHIPQWESEIFDGSMPAVSLSDEWNASFERIPEFPNLRNVSMCFDRHVDRWTNVDRRDRVFDDIYSRQAEMNSLMDMFLRCNAGVQELGLRCFTEFDNDAVYRLMEEPSEKDTKREQMLSGLKSLRMGIVHEQHHPERGYDLKGGSNQLFWERYPSRWLLPATNTLRHLTLYSNLVVGWFPKLELRNIHFPHLESLALGQFMFSHDWQFNWILSHSGTLKHLYLDRCSILYQIGHANSRWLDPEGYPVVGRGYPRWGHSRLMDETGFDETLKFINYETRWHDVFTRFSASLTHITMFRFGSSSGWNFETHNRYWGHVGMPIQPWEQESEISNLVFDQMYLLYNDWSYEYMTRWSDDDGLKRWERFWCNSMQDPPECFDKDRAALQALLRKLGLPCITRNDSETES